MAWPKLRKPSGPDRKPEPLAKAPPASPLVQRLVRKLEQLPGKDAIRIRAAQELEDAQVQGAEQLFMTCQAFVQTLNSLQEAMAVELSPEIFQAEALDAPNPTIYQINASGRIVQLSILPRETTISTEHFRQPYVLRGAVRWFNQELLDRHLVEEHQLFYCGERRDYRWLYQDQRTRKTGPVDQDYLAECLEELL